MNVEPIRETSLPKRAASLKTLEVGGRERLIVGTYQLDPDSQQRCGGFYLVDPSTLDIKREISLSAGVFRFQNADNNSNSEIVAALTNGRLARINLEDSGSAPSYSPILSEGMLLDCSVSAATTKQTICSDNFGKVFIIKQNSDSTIWDDTLTQWTAHKPQHGLVECEVWSCCWLEEECQTCATGAEDGLLKLWDLRSADQLPLLINRSHSAGVVFLDKFADISNSGPLLLSGSYDDHLRCFDLRLFDKPLSEIKLSGGVWHVETVHNNENHKKMVLVSCMYGGWSLVRTGTDGKLDLQHNHALHGDQLLYGATPVSLPGNSTTSLTIASCTFNDKMLRLERVNC